MSLGQGQEGVGCVCVGGGGGQPLLDKGEVMGSSINFMQKIRIKKTMAHLVPRPIAIQNVGLYMAFFLYVPNGTPTQLP